MRKEDVDRIITQMIVSKECAERGCMAYDDRVDGPGEWIRTEWVGLTDEETGQWVIVDYFPNSPTNVYGFFNSEAEARAYADQQGMGRNSGAYDIHMVLKHKNTVRMRRATRDEKISNPGVYWVEDKE